MQPLQSLQAPVAEPGQSKAYGQADPFPHAVMENLFPAEALDAVLAEFPGGAGAAGAEWRRFDNGREKKLAMQEEAMLGENSRAFLRYLNSAAFLQYLEGLTGIEGLIPDPYYLGGGLHRIERGGFLKIHADFNWHPKLKAHRRLNLLVYLNKEWKEEYGGHLELWDAGMKACKRKVLPVFGRCVVFNTTDFSYHGHPDPLACPEGWSRKSIALYYYSTSRPKGEISESHTTLFRRRQAEGSGDGALVGLPSLARKLAPPVLFDLAKLARGLMGRRG